MIRFDESKWILYHVFCIIYNDHHVLMQVYNEPQRCKRLYMDAADLLGSPPTVLYDIIISDLPDPVPSEGVPEQAM